MCTALTYKTESFYFGRTLDYDFSYCEEVTLCPRNFGFALKNGEEIKSHYAIIGMAYVKNGYPLYYDAVNEKGLCMAGLNFAGNAVFFEKTEGKNNIAQFELLPYILGKCESVEEAKKALLEINITNTPFDDTLPPSPLHFIVADKNGAITVESVADGLFVYDNPVGVLTNNPPFPSQMTNLVSYMHLSPREPQNNFSKDVELEPYSRGMGAIGLPGDLSSTSRFVRAAFTKLNSVSGRREDESVRQFFHILGTVSQTRGCCELSPERYEITIYTSCCNADKGLYYYTTYENSTPICVDMRKEDLDGNELVRFPLRKAFNVIYEN